MFLRSRASRAPFRTNLSSRMPRTIIILALPLILTSVRAPIGAQAASPAAQNFKLEGRAAAANSQWEQAAASFQKAIELQPRDASLRVELGAALAKSGRLTDAIASYEAALKVAPRYFTADLSLAAAYRA